MPSLTAKNKIVVIALAWLIASLLNFTYFFGILDASNQQSLKTIAKRKTDLASLQAQAESARQAQQDLLKLAQQPLQPENLFSRDITLVNEIKTLENLRDKFDLEMRLTDISGTINTAPKAKTITPLAVISYGINLNGSLSRVVDFIETLEHLGFITDVTNVSIGAADRDTVTASLRANFYLRK